MADDELDEDFEPEIEDEVDANVEDIDADVEDLEDVPVVADEDGVVDVVDDEEDVVEEPVARVKKKGEDEEDDDDELDPDDVEADLDAILKDRIAAADDDEDESEEDVVPAKADTPDGVVPKRANEFTCMGCFLLVNRNQFGPIDDLQCPVGESDCPAIEEILHPSIAKVVKAERPAVKAGKGSRKR